MSILEAARKALARIKAQRNGHAEKAPFPFRQYDINDRNDKSQIPAEIATFLPTPPNDQSPSHTLIRLSDDLATLLQALDESELVGVDCETTGLDPRTDRVRLLSLATDRGTYLVDAFQVDVRPLFPVLAEKQLVAHNALFDMGMLGALGFQPCNVVCTMLFSRLLTAGTYESNELKDCASRELGKVLDKSHQQDDWNQPLTREQLAYAATDVEVLLPLYKALDAKVQEAGLTAVADLERRCLLAVLWTATRGIAFDRDAWECLARSAGEEAGRLAAELDTMAPPPPGTLNGCAAWNWDSHTQVQQALALAGCTVPDTTDETLAAAGHPLADKIRQRREAQKRASTYGRDWLAHVAADGRVYAGWHQCGAKTGRMSSGEPNMQNIPRDPAYRRCFRAPGGRVLIKADYSQIELRIAAKVANEARMIEAYRQGEDLHTLTARRMTGKETVSKEERQLAKPVNFGLIYGLGTASLRRKAKTDYGLDLSEQDAARYRSAFFAAYPGIRQWHGRLKGEIGRVTETRTLTGRRCLVEAATWHGARANYVVQGTGGDGIKLALALLWERRAEAPGAFPVLAVHDEIVIEADAGQADAAAAWLKAAMVDAMAPLLDPVPVDVEVSIAPTWGG
jgi:DNA polymerase-1